jgi:hypothetical protein
MTCWQDEFEGKVLHSIEYKKAEGLDGKKVVIIGSCTAGGLSLIIKGFHLTIHARQCMISPPNATHGVGMSVSLLIRHL